MILKKSGRSTKQPHRPPLAIEEQRYHPQQLLLLASNTPRRGSLPISRSQLRQLQLEEAGLNKRTPSTEIYVPSNRTRLQDTPESLRKFLDTIRIDYTSEDSDSEVFISGNSTPLRVKSRENSVKKKRPLNPRGSLRSTKETQALLSTTSLFIGLLKAVNIKVDFKKR